MANKVSRRDFFKGFAAAAVGSAAGAASSVAIAAEAMSGHGHMDMGGHGAMTPMGAMNHKMTPRFDPNISYSPPPPLTGKQMGSVRTLSQPPLGYELDGKVKVFRLTAQPVRVFITRGTSEQGARDIEAHSGGAYEEFRPMLSQPKEMIAWGYNGQCPGPTIEAFEGDRIRIIFKNELPEPSSIHWHGVELPFAQDGAAGFHDFNAFPPTLPGETHVYEFTFYQSGTLLYHTGFNVMKQEGLGLGGLLVVHPQKYPQQNRQRLRHTAPAMELQSGQRQPEYHLHGGLLRHL